MERIFFVKLKNVFEEPPRPQVEGAVTWAALRGRVPLKRGGYLPSATRITEQQFLSLYEGDRRYPIYARAVLSLTKRPLELKDSYVSVFVKREKQIRTGKPDPVPRVIRPRDTRYNVEVGCYLKPLEKRLFKALNRLVRDVLQQPLGAVAKGRNMLQRARDISAIWHTFDDPICVPVDASRFDQHVSVSALRFEHWVYLQCFDPSDRQALGRLLSWQLSTTGFGSADDGELRFKCHGGRCSGDMNTSMGNVLLMICMVLDYHLVSGVPVRIYDDGDDCLIFMERRHHAEFARTVTRHFLSLGFTLVVEPPVDVFEQIQFCQAVPIYSTYFKEYVMVRNVHLSLAKDMICLSPVKSDAELRSWMSAVGTGGIAGTGGVPVVQNAYLSLTRMASGARAMRHTTTLDTGFIHCVRGMEGRYTRPCALSRLSFERATGIGYDAQLILEQQYDRRQLVGSIDGQPLEDGDVHEDPYPFNDLL